MDLLPILHRYQDGFFKHYGNRLSSDQQQAFYAMQHCRSHRSGEILLQCNACHHHSSAFHSCGHRSCPHCQHHENSQWLKRQTQKLLPVDYFMVTFTLPYEFRSLVFTNQKALYSALITCATDTLNTFAHNDKAMEADLGMTLVLHTHTRDAQFHPHVHIIVPGGCLNRRRKQWRTREGKYLFNSRQLATVFRAKFLASVTSLGLSLPSRYPEQWVAHCKKVGHGLPALTYLSRYLYRGVISEKNIVNDDGEQVTFRYKDSQTQRFKTCTLKGADFIWRLLQHVLPKGFRRVRDFGFLHGNAKRTLWVIQRALQVKMLPTETKSRPTFLCSCCQQPMAIIGFKPYVWRPG